MCVVVVSVCECVVCVCVVGVFVSVWCMLFVCVCECIEQDFMSWYTKQLNKLINLLLMQMPSPGLPL